MNRRWLSVVAVLALVLLTQVVEACPTCKDDLAADPASANLARGFYYSILFMLSMPYLVFTGIGLYFYSLVRQARRQREAAEKAAAALQASPTQPSSAPAHAEEDELVGV